MRRCVALGSHGQINGYPSDRARSIAHLTLARLLAGDGTAAAEYAAWVRTVAPGQLMSERDEALKPLWRAPQNPTLRRLAEALFAEERVAPSPWSRLLCDPKDPLNAYDERAMRSDLLRVPAFRALVIRRLSDRTPAGVVQPNESPQQGSWVVWEEGGREWLAAAGQPGRSVRLCDRVALALQRVPGAPRFDPLASVSRRDRACAELATFLERYGNILGRTHRWTTSLASIDFESMEYFGPLFTIRTTPASAADVAAREAIFALGDERPTRVARLDIPLPIEAEWRNDPDGFKGRSSGWIWQAEEVFEDHRWVRYYGYVGGDFIGRVPASEIRITDYRRATR